MRIKILANPKKQWTKELARKLKDHLSPHLVVRSNADVTICVGGDGTILYNSHKGRLDGPIIGIGTNSSYICQLHRDEWKKVTKILENKKEKVPMLQCKLGKKKYNVLNDVVIHASHYRVAEMTVKANGQTTSFEGDGMIVSTALGSAAYAYSAGGKMLKPTDRRISLVPICPYRRAFSPMLLDEDEKISITVGDDCAFILDGIFVRGLKKGEKVTVTSGPELTFFKGIGRKEGFFVESR